MNSENETASVDYVAFPKVLANLGIGYHWHDVDVSAFLNQRFQLQQYESDYLSVGGDMIKPERTKDYWRTDLHLNHQPNANLNLYMNFRNLFGRHNIKPSIYNSEGGLSDENFMIAIGGRYTL